MGMCLKANTSTVVWPADSPPWQCKAHDELTVCKFLAKKSSTKMGHHLIHLTAYCDYLLSPKLKHLLKGEEFADTPDIQHNVMSLSGAPENDCQDRNHCSQQGEYFAGNSGCQYTSTQILLSHGRPFRELNCSTIYVTDHVRWYRELSATDLIHTKPMIPHKTDPKFVEPPVEPPLK